MAIEFVSANKYRCRRPANNSVKLITPTKWSFNVKSHTHPGFVFRSCRDTAQRPSSAPPFRNDLATLERAVVAQFAGRPRRGTRPRWNLRRRICSSNAAAVVGMVRPHRRRIVSVVRDPCGVVLPDAESGEAGRRSYDAECNMKKWQPHQDPVLSDAEVRDVIQRALREESTRGGITIAELRQVAAELDIDPRAVEIALDQVVGLPIPGKPIRSWLKRQMTKLGRVADAFLPRTGRLVGLGLFGAVAGWLNAFLPTFAFNPHYPIAVAMIGVTLANLLARRLDQKLRPFIAETLAMWLLYGVAWSVTYGGVNDRIVFWVIFWMSQATMLGYIVMRDRPDADADLRVSTAAKEISAPEAPDQGLDTKRVRITRPVLFWRYFVQPV
jgi:hypothetical protein